MSLTKQFIEMQEAYESKISDLEAKLAESEKLKDDAMYNLALLNQDLSDTKEKLSIERRAYNILHGNYSTLISSYDQLKQQLAEKEKIEYTEAIKFVETSEPHIVAEELERLESEILDLEQSQNQAVIAELEKVKETFKKDCQQYSQFIILHDMFLIDIDQQIKSLKGDADGTKKNDN